jgi:hypothetical protein
MQTMPASQSGFQSLIRNPVKFRLFLFKKLPAAYFAGLRIKELGAEQCAVTVPYKWFTQNPFRSIYFACLSMAAEMSTGVLCMSVIYKRNPPVSMLVVSMRAEFFKKATGLCTFYCHDGASIAAAVERALQTGAGQTVEAVSKGYNADNEPIATFYITWSFKPKKSSGTL